MNMYTVYGRRTPTAELKDPEVFKMTIFAPNEIVAQSRFWYYLNILKRIKKANGQIVKVDKVEEDDQTVKCYGIHLRWRSRQGNHNQYREVRETTTARAVTRIFDEMASLYHVKYQDVIDNYDDLRRQKTMIVTPQEDGPIIKYPHPYAKAAARRHGIENTYAKKVMKIDE